LHLDPAAQYIGFVGSLTAWQGLETLIEAFANLPDDAGRCPRLLIIGDGSQRQNLENLAHRTGSSARIHFTGAIPYTQIPDFIAACDVLAAPKRPLTSGYSTLKILEYMACARPVIASRVAGMEMIEQAGAGLLSIPGDPIDLQRTISQILDLPEAERLAMGQRARQFVVEHCTWEHTVDRILALAAP
jgi:glycosyltransferase involved in cell wall biosynthesis